MSRQQGLFAERESDGETVSMGSKKKKATRKGRVGGAAERMAKDQREISVSEFFTKNRHLLGFDSPRKALLTAIKEAVDNSLDACEEARIVPEVLVEISQAQGPRRRVHDRRSRTTGRASSRTQVPLIFGKLLYGSKFHRLRQSRGQQGIGISAAGMYGQLTTGNAVRVKSRTSRSGRSPTSSRSTSTRTRTSRSAPTSPATGTARCHGTRVEIDMEGEYRRGHAERRRVPQAGRRRESARVDHVPRPGRQQDRVRGRDQGAPPRDRRDQAAPPRGRARHPDQDAAGVSEEKWVKLCLQRDFSRVGPKVAEADLQEGQDQRARASQAHRQGGGDGGSRRRSTRREDHGARVARASRRSARS